MNIDQIANDKIFRCAEKAFNRAQLALEEEFGKIIGDELGRQARQLFHYRVMSKNVCRSTRK